MGELVELVAKEVDVLDGSDGELVEPPVTDCVAVCVDELCPSVEVDALEELLDGPDELAWLVEPPVDDCVAVCVDELCP